MILSFTKNYKYQKRSRNLVCDIKTNAEYGFIIIGIFKLEEVS